MIIIDVKEVGGIEKALKMLKSKVSKTKQNSILFSKKTYNKKSVERRAEVLQASYKEQKRQENKD